jgi:putative membrane protein
VTKNHHIGGNIVKRFLTLLCCFSLCSIPGLAQKKTSGSSMNDQQFVNFAGQTDMVDANLGQLARTVAPSQPIKDFAQKLVTDQTDDFQELSKAVHESSLHVPNAIDKDHDRAMIDPFQKLKGAAFDRRFVKEMIEGDTKAIDIYKKEAVDAQTPALRSYAEEALPVLQTHLSDARKMEATKTATKKG